MVVVLVNGVLFAFQNQERSFLQGEELVAEVGLLRQEKGVVFSSVKGMQAQETSWDLQQKVVRQEKLPGFVFFLEFKHPVSLGFRLSYEVGPWIVFFLDSFCSGLLREMVRSRRLGTWSRLRGALWAGASFFVFLCVPSLWSCYFNLLKRTGGSGIAEFDSIFWRVGVSVAKGWICSSAHFLLFLWFVFGVFKMQSNYGSGGWWARGEGRARRKWREPRELGVRFALYLALPGHVWHLNATPSKHTKGHVQFGSTRAGGRLRLVRRWPVVTRDGKTNWTT